MQRQVSVRDLSVTYWPNTPALTDIDLDLYTGQVMGIVGESGCGKSTLASALVGDIPNAQSVAGQVLLAGDEGDVDLVQASYREKRQLWGSRIAMVYQDPAQALNPAFKIGRQVDEAVARRPDLVTVSVRERTLELLRRVRLPAPEHMVHRYPHQLSGGQQQRVVIAMALAASPDLLVLDEPTTGLDVTTEARILDLVQDLKAEVDAAIVYITHNLAVVARVADRVAVMYAGELCEVGSVEALFEQPMAPYTKGLFSCVPSIASDGTAEKRLRPIPGSVSSSALGALGCRFADRCPFATEVCETERPELVTVGSNGHRVRCLLLDQVSDAEWPDPPDPVRIAKPHEPDIQRVVLAARGLGKTYGRDRRRFMVAGPLVSRSLEAVKDVSFEVHEGETLGIVGESGCGKTTLLGNLCGLVPPTKGEILLDGERLEPRLRHRSTRELQSIQMVFQNPDKSLNPQHTVERAVGRAVHVLNPDYGKNQVHERVVELLQRVGLDESYLGRPPAQLSGGEKQRVAIARALTGEPYVVLADEVTSALDVSVRASTLNLLKQLQRRTGVAFVFVSHDMSAIRYLSDRVMVLYLGVVMETGPAEAVFAPPYHPYAEALISAIPVPDPTRQRPRIQLEGAVPSASDRPSGCPFHTRCPRKKGRVCEDIAPPVMKDESGHEIRCHWSLQELQSMQTGDRPVAKTNGKARGDAPAMPHEPQPSVSQSHGMLPPVH